MDMKKMLDDILRKLKIPFCSEADFQFTLAWKIKEELQGVGDVILEYPHPNKKEYYDILVIGDQGIKHLIELKYRTKSETISRHGCLGISLKNQGAHPLGRYHFMKDVQRLENQTIANGCSFCLMLTNDPLYYNDDNNCAGVIDIEFRFYKKMKRGSHKWKNSNNPYWKKKNLGPVELMHEYDVEWKGYVDHFKYLLLEIPPNNSRDTINPVATGFQKG